jgi:hypothetical protein
VPTRIVLACASFVAITGLVAVFGIAGARTSGPAVGKAVDLSSLEPFHITLTGQAAQGAAVSQSQAMSIALTHSVGATDANGQLLSGVHVEAQYGLLSQDRMARQGSDGIQHLLYRNVPAWVVTFSGPTVGGLAQGPALPKGIARSNAIRSHTSTVVNTEAVVIDAQTGNCLMILD